MFYKVVANHTRSISIVLNTKQYLLKRRKKIEKIISYQVRKIQRFGHFIIINAMDMQNIKLIIIKKKNKVLHQHIAICIIKKNCI